MHGQVSFIYVNPCMFFLNCVGISCTSHFILSLVIHNPFLVCTPWSALYCVLSFCLLSFHLCVSCNEYSSYFLPHTLSLSHTYTIFLCLLSLSNYIYILLSLGYHHLYLVHNFCLHLCHLMEYLSQLKA